MKEYRLILTYLVAVLLVLIALICGGCSTTKYVPVETIKRDTVYQSKIERDSVYLHDSVYVKEWQKGDTIYRDRDRWHTKYVEKEVHDTLYQSKTDSIAVPYPVEKELTWWERKKIEFGELAMVVMAGLLCFVVIKSKLK
jgi:hypothetical protein